MENRMQGYIDEQPAVLRAMLDGREALAAPFVARFGGQTPDRVVLVGSGSSYHAALMAKPVIERALGCEATAVVPTRFEDELGALHAQRPLYLLSSQGGHSTNTYARLQALRAGGAAVCAVTADAASPIGREADLCVALPIGEERIGAKTKGMSATALTLCLLALELGRARGTVPAGFYEDCIRDFYGIVDAMPDNLKRSMAWCGETLPALAPSPYLDVVAEGAVAGAAMEGRLKLLETIYRPVIYYEFEEYLHGVQNALSDRTHLLCLLPDAPAERARMRRLAEFARSQGAHCYLVARGEDGAGLPGELTLAASCGPLLAGFELLPAMQTLSAQLSAFCGIDITKPKFAGFAARFESKLPGEG